MSAHTQGPWLISTAPTSAGLCHKVFAADQGICWIYGDGIRPGIDDAIPRAQLLMANVRLIASAPDLLEALQGVIAAWDALHGSTRYAPGTSDRMEDIEFREMQKARAAIAKALWSAT